MSGAALGDFSVLLPVYAGDRSEFLERSLRSVTEEQTLKPGEIVVVADGPLEDELDGVLRRGLGRAQSELGIPHTLVELPENRGLAGALNAGLEACRFEIVARQDADDISLPDRFRKQREAFTAKHSLLGTAIAEFDHDEADRVAVRAFPTDARELRDVARRRCPFNHPSVMYRKADVLAVGGYKVGQKVEDYWLWSRMIMAGQLLENLGEVLVLYRVGAGSYERRGGLRMIPADWDIQLNFLRSGFIGVPRFAANVGVRLVYRLVPGSLRKLAYRRMLHASG